MAGIKYMIFSTISIISLWACLPSISADETILSKLLTPTQDAQKDNKKLLSRQSRSGYYYPYEERYASGRQFLERLAQYERPRCGRCLDDRYDDRDDARSDPYDRPSRDRYDDDRRPSHRPTNGNRYDRNQNNDRDDNRDDDNRRYNTDRRTGTENKNGSDTNTDDREKRPYDDKDDDRRPSGGRKGGNRDRDKNRDRDRDRYDDRDRYRPDYYDRFLRDPSRERDRDPYRERDPYDDPYRERRPLVERYPYTDRYDDGYGGRYDGYYDYRRPVYDDRGNGYDDRGYGGYGRGRGPHDRPWDETYRGQSGWDAGGRGYYFASGRPEYGSAQTWGGGREYANQYPREYVRPEAGYSSGWQNVNRQYADQGAAVAYPQQQYGYQQNYDRYGAGGAGGSGGASGWQNVRPYRDQSSQVGKRGSNYGPSNQQQTNSYSQASNTGTNSYTSSTTPGTSYLYQREDEQVTAKDGEVSTKTPS